MSSSAFSSGIPPSSSSSPSLRALFDEVSLSVVSFLEQHRGVSDVQFYERSGVRVQDLAQWHSRNAPYKLPHDLVHFLLMADGLLLRWHIKYNGEMLPLGCMHLNAISQIKSLEVGEIVLGERPDLCNDALVSSSSGDGSSNHPKDTSHESHGTQEHIHVAAFDIDSICMDGRMAMIYDRGAMNPSFWFQDLSCQWSFVAGTFTDYMRLMVMHLGLPHWQYAFTDVGLNPTTKQWFSFMSPERLAIDLSHSKRASDREEALAMQAANQEHNNGDDDEAPTKVNVAQIDKMVKMSSRSLGKKKGSSSGESHTSTGEPGDNSGSQSSTSASLRAGRPGSAPGRRINAASSNHSSSAIDSSSVAKRSFRSRPDTAVNGGKRAGR